ncbi:dienelactone hydrolase family protein [Flindersiella endophytica]
MSEYPYLSDFGDWVVAAEARGGLWNGGAPVSPALVREALGFGLDDERPADVRVERTWEAGGVAGEEVSWSVGYGPRTRAYVLKPAGAEGLLPGVVALHSHDGFKFYGKEKIADGPAGCEPAVAALRSNAYGDRAFANALARAGFVVLAHDVFLWGSRRFAPHGSAPSDPSAYNAEAGGYEHVVEKYAAVLGTTLAGVVSYEDRVALAYLRSRADVDASRTGCAGLSGGGCRSALLLATSDHISAAVVVGMMSTYPGLLGDHVAKHTWMFFPPAYARLGDWPDLAACRAPTPLLVQYDEDDNLFTMEGMRAADERLAALYRAAGAAEAYVGQFYPGPHKFDVPMQEAAFAWLGEQLTG